MFFAQRYRSVVNRNWMQHHPQRTDTRKTYAGSYPRWVNQRRKTDESRRKCMQDAKIPRRGAKIRRRLPRAFTGQTTRVHVKQEKPAILRAAPGAGGFNQIGLSRPNASDHVRRHVWDPANDIGVGLIPSATRYCFRRLFTIWFTAFGFALPPVAFITCPTNQPASLGFSRALAT